MNTAKQSIITFLLSLTLFAINTIADNQSTNEKTERKDINEPSSTKLEVFGVPLNASFQDVVVALEKNEIEISNGLIDKKEFDKILENEITNTYISQSQKEEILRLLQENKIKSFCVNYKGGQRVAYPQSLTTLLRVYYPVLEKYYDLYNSQFFLECRTLPDYITSQGVSRMLIFFASTEQGEPKSFLISLAHESVGKLGGSVWFATYGSSLMKINNLHATLTNKYGSPKVHFPSDDPGGHYCGVDYRPLGASLFAALKQEFPNCETKPTGQIYPKAVRVLKVSVDDPFKDQFVFDPFVMKGFFDRHEDAFSGEPLIRVNFLLEWNFRDVKILLDNNLGKDADGSWLIMSETLNYIHWPTIESLDNMYEKLEIASKEAEEKVLERGKKGF